METISVIALSRADALRRQMDIVANNVANVSTTGFKSEQPLFIEYVEQASSNEKYSMVQDYTSLRNLAAGPLTQTGNQFDIALEGDGYLAVDTVDGPRYTRGGGLNLDSNRDLVNANGLPVLDDNGNAINIPSNVRQVRISPDGSVFSETGEIAKSASSSSTTNNS
jgi:flagellar basal-body rod protein FlgF